MLFSEWFRGQIERKDAVGIAAKKWNDRDGVDRRGRVNAARLVREGAATEQTASQIFEEYGAIG